MPTQQVPFFLSSAAHHSANESTTRFDVVMNPPFEIPQEATSARAFIHSATVPFVFPNVIAGENGLRVILPIKDVEGHVIGNGMREVTITIPPGLYTLDPTQGSGTIAAAINERVNQVINDDTNTGDNAFEGELIGKTTEKPDFCTLEPDYVLNRVKLTLNHSFTGIDFTHAESTLKILGFDGRVENEVEKFAVGSSPNNNLALTITATQGGDKDYVVEIPGGGSGIQYTAPALERAINLAVRAALKAASKHEYDIIQTNSLIVSHEGINNSQTGVFDSVFINGKWTYADKTKVYFTHYNDSQIMHHDAGGGDPAKDNPTLAGNASTLGKVGTVIVTNNGTGYNTASNVSAQNFGPVISLTVDAVGTGYTTQPKVAATGGSGAELLVSTTADGAGAITGITVVSGGIGYVNGETVTLLGGGGDATATVTVGTASGLTLDVTGPGTVSAINATPSNHGINYATETGLDTSGGSGTGLKVDITAIPTGAAGSVSDVLIANGGFLVPGTGYSEATDVATTSATGTGLTVDITVNAGAIHTIAVRARGQGYSFEDVVQITGGGANAESKVFSLAAAGKINDVTLLSGGSGYVVGDTVDISQGTGLDSTAAQGGQVEITAIADGALTIATVASTGTGYAVDDFVSVLGGNYGRVQVASLVRETYDGYQVSSILGRETTDTTGASAFIGREKNLVSANSPIAQSYSITTANVWKMASATKMKSFLATNKADIDKVTEIGISCNPLVTGAVTSSGKAARGVLARFQVEGLPGSVMSFKPSTVIKSDVSSFIGSPIDRLTFGLVDQNGDQLPDLQEEDWAAVMVVEYDMP